MLINGINSWMWAMTGLSTVALDERTFLSLSTVVMVLSGGWWLARKIQSLEDGLDEIRRRYLGCDKKPLSRRRSAGDDN